MNRAEISGELNLQTELNPIRKLYRMPSIDVFGKFEAIQLHVLIEHFLFFFKLYFKNVYNTFM